MIPTCPGMEEFRDIPGYPGYQISNTGKVFSRNRNKFLTFSSDKDGYLRIGISNNNIEKHFRIHRLVGLTFIPNLDNKPCINHIDGNKSNNNVCNLEWNTIAENNKHARETLRVACKPVILVKDGIEYSFRTTKEVIIFLKTYTRIWKRLMTGLIQDINGFKIKK